MRNVRLVGVLLTSLAVLAVCTWAEEAVKPEPEPATVEMTAGNQTVCPVSGKSIDKKQYVDYAGRRVYFCCDKCPATFKEDPAKYIMKAEADGVKFERVNKPQTLCPIMGGKIDKAIFVDAEGFRIYVCCNMCPDKVKANPRAAVMKILANGEMPEMSLVVCPKCGEIKSSAKCCDEKAPRCEQCGLQKGSVACCAGLKPAEGQKEVTLCPKCGWVKGSTECCNKDAEKCNTCGMQKGSPLCCHAPDVLPILERWEKEKAGEGIKEKADEGMKETMHEHDMK